MSNRMPSAGLISILEARQYGVSMPSSKRGIWALLSIGILLWIVLRRFGDVLLTLVPPLVAGIVTLELCVLIWHCRSISRTSSRCRCCSASASRSRFITSWRGARGRPTCSKTALTRRGDFQRLDARATAFGSLWFSKPSRYIQHGQIAGAVLDLYPWRRPSCSNHC